MQPVLTTMRTLASDLRVRIGALALVAVGVIQ